MKKTLVALAALAATSAFAQSSVTVSGIVNYGLHNDVTKTTTFGGLKGDRNQITFGVVEDLGGGTNATATLQMRFNSGTGANGYNSSNNSPAVGAGATQFEQAAIGLNSGMGNVRVGRFTNALGVADVHVFEDSKYGTNASRALYGRFSNQIQLTSPNVSGFTGILVAASGKYNQWGNPGGLTGAGFITGVDYSKQNQTGAASGGVRDFGALVLNYSNGPLFVHLAQINGHVFDKHTKVSGTYDFGKAKVYFAQHNQKNDIAVTTTTAAAFDAVTAAVTAGGAGSGLKAHKSTEYGVMVPYGAFTLRAGLQTNDKGLDIADTTDATKVKKTAIGGEYALSKRTEIQYQRMNVKNGVAATNTALGASGFGDSTGSAYFIGIQHKF